MKTNDKPQEVLEGCQNPKGCGKVATETVTVRGTDVELCAYCADDVRERL